MRSDSGGQLQVDSTLEDVASPDAPAEIEFFATEQSINQLQGEVDLASAQGDPLLMLLASLAWQLRQRDSKRSLQLASRAQQLLGAKQRDMTDVERRRLGARLLLIRGEAEWLASRLDAASQLAQSAMSVYADLGDAVGRADSHWLLAMLATDRGDWPGKAGELEAMATAAFGVDPIRAETALAAQAYFAAFPDREQAHTRWWSKLAAGQSGRHPAAGCWAEDFLAVCTHHGSDFEPAIRHFPRPTHWRSIPVNCAAPSSPSKALRYWPASCAAQLPGILSRPLPSKPAASGLPFCAMTNRSTH